jgi:hypothetical protein
MRRIRSAFGLSALLGSALPLCAQGLPATPPDHVVIVIMENHSAGQIIGSSNAPYINSLANAGANMGQSFAVAHPSEPNYLAFFSGSTQGLASDACPLTYSGDNLGAQLIAAGKTFAAYSEDLPSVGYTGCTSGAYARKHAPWVNFTNVPSATHKPFTAFPTDFTQLPTLSFVIPNLNNDMHDGTVNDGDVWLKTHLDAYAQWAKTHNSLLIVTFDEDDFSSSNQIATIFYGPMVKTGVYNEHINHYYVLRTLEDLYHLPYAGNASTATTITDIWQGTGALSAAITAPAGTTSVTSGTPVAFAGQASGGTAPYTYTWNFGDGATAAGATASHAFFAAGDASQAYTVTFTAKDALGAVSSATRQVIANPIASGQELIQNGGFETGATNWTGTTSAIGTWSGEPAYAGTKNAWLQGNGRSSSENLTQTFAIPAGVGSATLSFWLHIDTAETTSTKVYDTLKVQIVSGSTTTTLATFSNLNKATGYAKKTFDLSGYKGKTITVKFLGSEDASLQTSFVLDGVSVLAK